MALSGHMMGVSCHHEWRYLPKGLALDANVSGVSCHRRWALAAKWIGVIEQRGWRNPAGVALLANRMGVRKAKARPTTPRTHGSNKYPIFHGHLRMTSGPSHSSRYPCSVCHSEVHGSLADC